MIDVAKSMPVNRDLEPGNPVLSAPDIWRGLVMKAENPVPRSKESSRRQGPEARIAASFIAIQSSA
jgi:hypothetical protein